MSLKNRKERMKVPKLQSLRDMSANIGFSIFVIGALEEKYDKKHI